MKKCPNCEVELTKERSDIELGEDSYKLIKCKLCETATTWLDGNLRSYTTSDGKQTIVNSPIKKMINH